MSAEPSSLRPLLGSEKYRVDRLLAVGSYCDVFAGHHAQLELPVALKVLSRAHADDEQAIERMRLEGHVLSRLDHPNVVRCLDRGYTEDSRPYLVLERLTGETLQELLVAAGVIDELTAIHWACDWLEALGSVHSRGVIHRDATLSNVLVHRGANGSVLKLIDFGLAKVAASAPADAPAPLAIPTDPANVVGALRCVSPEAARGQSIDHRADLYAVGVGLYTMLSGVEPFGQFRTVGEVLHAHAYERPPELSQVCPDVTLELERLVMRLMEKSPADRFQSAALAAEALRDCASRLRQRTMAAAESTAVTGGVSAEHLRIINLERTRGIRVFSVGDRCGPFVIRRYIGGGGWSEVYEASDPDGLSRSVALKVLKRALATKPEMREQFRREMRILASIRHPNMVTVHQAGEDNGTWWMAMELLDGLSLREHQQRHGRPDLATACKWARQVASAVHAAHRLGIVHRDLKPENIFVTEQGDACVLDAGIARMVLDANRDSFRHITGTVAYAAPETLLGTPVDSRSDVYSWGHVLFEMIVGRHAFCEEAPPHALPDTRELTACHIHRPIPRREKVAPGCPEALWALVQCSTAKERNDRPEHMGVICSVIDHYLDEVRHASGATCRPTSTSDVKLAFAAAAGPSSVPHHAEKRRSRSSVVMVALPSFAGGVLCGVAALGAISLGVSGAPSSRQVTSSHHAPPQAPASVPDVPRPSPPEIASISPAVPEPRGDAAFPSSPALPAGSVRQPTLPPQPKPEVSDLSRSAGRSGIRPARLPAGTRVSAKPTSVGTDVRGGGPRPDIRDPWLTRVDEPWPASSKKSAQRRPAGGSNKRSKP